MVYNAWVTCKANGDMNQLGDLIVEYYNGLALELGQITRFRYKAITSASSESSGGPVHLNRLVTAFAAHIDKLLRYTKAGFAGCLFEALCTKYESLV